MQVIDDKVGAAEKRKKAAEATVKDLAEDQLRELRESSKVGNEKELQLEQLERKKRDLQAQVSRLEKEVEVEEGKYRSVKHELEKTVAELLE